MRSPVSRPITSPGELQEVMQSRFPVSEEQWPAVSAPTEPTVVIAGAGSGKTTLMAARVVYLVHTGQVRADEVLGLTFTTKAAGELAADVRAALARAGLLPDVASDDERIEPTVATYNAYAASLLTEQGLRIGHEPDVRVMADASRYQLAGRAVARHAHPVELLTDSPKHVIGNLLALDGAMSEHLLTPDDVRAFDARERVAVEAALSTERAKADLQKILDKIAERAELLRLVEDYRRLKAELGLMDFSDQIALATRLARDHPDVGTAERGRFRIVLLDEYQDTSVAQAQFLGALFSGPDPEHGRGHAVTAVGDPHQAIYGWRGASVSNILHVGRTFPRADGSPDIPRHHLTVSRRSDVSILEAAHHLAQPLYADPAAPVVALRPAEGAGPGEVRASLHGSAAAELAWLPGQVHAAQRHVASLPEDLREPGSWRRIGVLARDNATAAEVFDALTADNIPVEIVGLNGLLRLPEVSMVVSTLTLLHDLTANADLLNLLTGPRWAIGPRDLAVLGRRARDLAVDPEGRTMRGELVTELEQAVAGADPTEILSLCDALDDPGDGAYSTAARERFALLSQELRMLRRHSGESLLDLVRLIIDVTGIDVELSSSTSEAAAARRDNLDLFVKAVADFQAIDGDHSLGSLLAYLEAEDELGTGLDIATPTEADSVKLLTVHRAKGLEWDAVFMVGVSERKFPTDRSRSLWTSVGWVLPSPLRGDALDLPQLGERSRDGIEEFKQRSRDHEAVEELRLGYVAVTRARHLLSVSSHWRLHRGVPIGPSRYQQAVVDAMAGRGLAPDPWTPEPEVEALAALGPAPQAWPVTEHTSEALRRLEAAELVREADPALDDDGLDLESLAEVQAWDDALERLLAEARADRSDVVDVPLPSSLSATALARLRDDPEGFARELARPMPRPPAPAARFGTRFHAWVEARFGQQQLIDADELPGRADAEIEDADDLATLVAAFEQGEFADRAPHAVETPFALVLDGQVVRGRIDAVYAEQVDPSTGSGGPGEPGFLVVDWKTNRQQSAEPLQLAVYRLAWAELAGVPIERVRAGFYYVRHRELVEPDDLPGRDELERLLGLE
ncbi:MAG: UvrD-helicase domain-containing protein [Nocardioides sp.]